MKTYQTLCLSLVLATSGDLFANDYAESSSGELSDDGASPTAVTFSLGSNAVSGKMGRGALVAGKIDADIWTFNIANGQQLSGITVTQLDGSGSLVNGSFLAIAAGTGIDKASAAGHLSNLLVASTGDILGTLASTKQFSAGFGSAPGVSGVTSPLGAGNYTVWFQEAGQASVDYSISFELQPVPEPSTLALGAAGLGLLALIRRRQE